jgi:hypothetical protein
VVKYIFPLALWIKRKYPFASDGAEKMLVLPWVEVFSVFQSGLGALLLFLILQALRNHFKIK